MDRVTVFPWRDCLSDVGVLRVVCRAADFVLVFLMVRASGGDVFIALFSWVVEAPFFLEVDCVVPSLGVLRTKSRKKLPTTTRPHLLHRACLTASPLFPCVVLVVLLSLGTEEDSRARREEAIFPHATILST
jgi:hypothetical protein